MLSSLLLISGTSLADAPMLRHAANGIVPRSSREHRQTLSLAGRFEARASDALSTATTFASNTGVRFAAVAETDARAAFRSLPRNVANAAHALGAAAGDQTMWEGARFDRRTFALERNLLLADVAAVRACAQALEMMDAWIGRTQGAGLDRFAGFQASASRDQPDRLVPLRIAFDRQDATLSPIESAQALILHGVAFGHWTPAAQMDNSAAYEPEDGAPSLRLTLEFLPAFDATPGAAFRAPWRDEAIGRPHGERLQIALFAQRKLDAVFASGALTYATFEAMSDRAVVFGQPFQNGMPHFPAQVRIERIELGRRYGFDRNSLGITPYVAVQAEHVRLPPGDGQTAGDRALLETSFSPSHENDVMQEIGLQIDRSIGDLDSVTFVGRFGWVHDYADGFAKPARIAFPGTTFDFFGPASSRDAAMISLGIDGELARGLTFQIETQSDLSPTDRAIGGDAAIAFHW